MTEVDHLPRLSSGAERMRRYRERRRLGHSCVTVELRGDEIAVAAATRNESLPVFAWLHRDEGAKR